MPFTVAHAAAALPLNSLFRSRLPMSALMVGAMAPDFAYFVPGSVPRFTTHDLPGIFQFSWPVGLAVWLVFVKLLERPTISLLPDAWRTRIAPTGRLSLSLLALASLAIMLGAASHIAWDSFTHAATPVVNALPTLREVRVDVGIGSVRLFRFLQYLSSVVGLVALAIWAFRLRRLPALPPSQILPAVSLRLRVAAFATLFLTTGAVALLNYALQPDDLNVGNTLFYLLMGGMSGWAAAWCAVAVWVRLAHRNHAYLTPQPPSPQ